MYHLKYSNVLVEFVDADWATDMLNTKLYIGFCFVIFGSVNGKAESREQWPF